MQAESSYPQEFDSKAYGAETHMVRFVQNSATLVEYTVLSNFSSKNFVAVL